MVEKYRTRFYLMEEVIMENNVRCEMSQSESLIMDFCGRMMVEKVLVR